jgi:hypothetical protein
MRLSNFHWSIWARMARESVDIGFPHKVTFYLPPRLGNVFDDLMANTASDQDFEIAELIGQAVVALHRDRQQHAEVLRAFHGAHKGAPDSRAERIKRLHMERRTVYRLTDEAQSWVEGHLNALITVDSVAQIP